MSCRARLLAARLAPLLPGAGPWFDIGSGTGHNAVALSRVARVQIIEADITNINTCGPAPVRFAGALPFRRRSGSAALLLYVLQYPDTPEALLREAARVSDGRVIVAQSTYIGAGWLALWLAEILTGPLAYLAARGAGLVPPGRFTLATRRIYTRAALQRQFGNAGLRIHELHAQPWPFVRVSDDLFVLEFDDAATGQDHLDHYCGSQ
jgi:SAM-dependent methyltransferase